MNLNWGGKTVKYLILTFNLLFLVTGVILIAVGASIKAYYTQYDLFLDSKYFTLPNLLIATGTLIFIISFLGCYGAMKESWILLLTYSFLLAIIFIFEFSAGIAGYVLRDKTSNYLETTLKNNMKLYNNDSYAVTKMWDTIQEEFQCCGVTNMSDWQNIYNLEDNKLPVSCCPSKYGTTGDFSCYSSNSEQITSSSISSSTPSSISTSTSTISTTSPPPLPSTDTPPKEPNNSPGDNTSGKSFFLHNSSLSSVSANSTTPPYEVGCEEAFGNFLKSHAVEIGGLGFALAVIQLFGVGFSCYLSKKLKNSYYST